MKKFLILFTLLIIICIVYIECKKDQNSSANKNLSSAQQQLIANAKTYFENNVQSKGNNGRALSDVINSNSGQLDPIQSLIKNAVWSKAQTIQLSIGEIVVVPIQFNDSLYTRPNSTDSNTRLPLSNLSKLIVYTDSSDQTHAEVVTAFPDSNFVNNSNKQFSGIAYIQDWQGNFLRAYHYIKGKIKKLKLNNGSKNKNISTNALMAPDPDDGCTQNDYYNCELTEDGPSNCTYLGTTYTGCDDDTPAGGGGGGGGGSSSSVGGAPSGTDYGTVAGGSRPKPTTPVFSSIDTIGNNLTNSCFSNVLNSLEATGLKNEITQILHTTFGVNDNINLVFKEVPSLSDNADAKTIPLDGGISPYGSYYDISISLNDQQLAKASKEFIAETIFHEIIHGYLEANGSLQNELSQHITMIKSYVDCEVSALKEIFPNLTTHDAQCLVIGGYGDVESNSPSTLNSVYAAYNLTSADVVQTNNGYKNGSKGSTCGTVSKMPIAP
jgi:hypothetical protein